MKPDAIIDQDGQVYTQPMTNEPPPVIIDWSGTRSPAVTPAITEAAVHAWLRERLEQFRAANPKTEIWSLTIDATFTSPKSDQKFVTVTGWDSDSTEKCVRAEAGTVDATLELFLAKFSTNERDAAKRRIKAAALRKEADALEGKVVA